MKINSRTSLLWGTVGVLGLAALFIPWVSQVRVLSSEMAPAAEISVTSGEDGGPGSLREAIFAAAKNPEKTRIRITVREITLQTPLPPLVNAKGIEIDGGESHAVIEAKALRDGPVLDVSTPDTHILDLRIQDAPEQAILVRAFGARIKGVALSNCSEGIYLVDGVEDTVIEQSRFANNRTGVHLQPGTSRVIAKNNEFVGQKKASIWAVSPTPRAAHIELKVRGNRFKGDFQSIVLIYSQGEIVNNSFEDAEDTALYLAGSGSVAKNNRISNGGRFGLSLDSSLGIVIEDNEIDHNAAGGILVQSSNGINIRHNKLYANGYGVAVLFGAKANPNTITDNLLLEQKQDGFYIVGGSPIVRNNTVRESGGAGMRLLTYTKPDGELLTPSPFLAGNDLSRNTAGSTIAGAYAQDAAPPELHFDLRLERSISLAKSSPRRRGQ